VNSHSFIKASPPSDPTPGTVFVSAHNVVKTYGAVRALRDVSVDFHSGTVHALVGANGAGKSTLINVLAGVVPTDSGTVTVDGEQVAVNHPSEAARLGMSFIHQELQLVPKFSVLQNLALGQVERRYGFTRWRDTRARAGEVLARLGADLPLDEPVERLTVNQRWMVALGHALLHKSRFIAMDEPTASFTAAEVTRLMQIIRDLRDDGVTVVYVSHRLEEILDISQLVTVFRNGEVAGTFETATLNRRSLTEHIVGHGVNALQAVAPPPDKSRPIVLSLENVASPPAVRRVSLQLAEGEILGIAGLVGSGRTETARVVAGLDRPTEGEMQLLGKPYAPKSTYDAIRRGVAFLPEERRSQGLVLGESIDFNVNMATTTENRRSRWLPFLSVTRSRAATQTLMERFAIKAPSSRTTVGHLSGGNQQKVVLSKCVRIGPRVLILDEPTVGVDVRAREDIYKHIAELAESGTAVVIISSDFEELLACHRVVVLHEGATIAVAEGERISKENLTHMCYGDVEAA
jgi:ribose transport system ATP-binding protein